MKQNWKEFAINNFLGVQSSTTSPDINACKDILNFDTRDIVGALVSRSGIQLKYSAPTTINYPQLANLSVLSFENFLTKEQEITILVAKATLNPETSVGNIGVPEAINIITIWSSHSWDGTTWTEGWTWLNECVLTKINDDDATKYVKHLDFNSSKATDYFAGWTINRFQKISSTEVNDVAKIIKSSTVSGKVKVEITDNNSTWTGDYQTLADGDQIILMKNYIPLTNLKGNYAATNDEVTFHKIYDQLRIGFGGYENRLGLAVFTKSNYFVMNSSYFSSYTEAELNKISGYNQLCVSPYTAISDEITINPYAVSGDFTAGTKYFKLSVVLDDDNEVYVSGDTQIKLEDNEGINYNISYKLGSENKRAKKIRIYFSNDGEEYFHIRTMDLTDKSVDGHLSTSGYWLSDDYDYTADEWYDPDSSDAGADIDSGDSDSIGGWTAGNEFTTISSVTSEVSDYALKFTGEQPFNYYWEIMAYTELNFREGTEFDVSLYVKGDGDIPKMGVRFGEGSGFAVPLTTSFVKHTFRIGSDLISQDDPVQRLTINATWFDEFNTGPTSVYIDRISIKKVTNIVIEDDGVIKVEGTAQVGSDTILGDEIKSALGYSPTRNLIKSWDQCIVTQGRAYFINAYINERYANKIFFSAISGFGANMYDVAATTTGFIDLEKFDGNDIVGAEVYSNMDFHIGKRNSVQRIDPISQQTREISFGDGLVSRRSIVNFGDILAWASEYGIKGSNGIEVTDLSKETIYDTYKTLSKESIIATRAEKGNAYMFCEEGSGSIFIMSKRGWIKFSLPVYPTKFSSDKEGNIWFMANSDIYKFNENFNSDTLLEGSVKSRVYWESIEFDIYKIAQLTSKQRFYIRSVWALYKGQQSNLELKIYLDGATTEANPNNKTLPSAQTLSNESLRLPIGSNCTKFKVVFESDNNGIENSVELHGIGIDYKILPIGQNDDTAN